jgi:hypothetical protein
VKRLRAYIDNSVVSGCFDERFAEASNALMQMAREGEITLVVSDLLLAEVSAGPEHVRGMLPSVPASSVARVETAEEAKRLQAQYVEAGVVTATHHKDALHVAIATVTGADVLASWNLKHIARLSRIRGFNAVNVREGYAQIDIRTPEVII